MKVIIDICLVPLGVGVSVSPYIARCQKIFEEAGLAHKLHAYGTSVEGDWDAVMSAVKRCHRELHDEGVPRITSSMRLGTRIDRQQSMQDKIDSVSLKLRDRE